MEDVLKYTKKQEVVEVLEEAEIALDLVQGLAPDLAPEDEDQDPDLTQEAALNLDPTLEIVQSLDLQEILVETDLDLDQLQDPRIIEIRMEIDLHLEKEMYQDLDLALILVPDLDQGATKDGNTIKKDSTDHSWYQLTVYLIMIICQNCTIICTEFPFGLNDFSIMRTNFMFLQRFKIMHEKMLVLF